MTTGLGKFIICLAAKLCTTEIGAVSKVHDVLRISCCAARVAPITETAIQIRKLFCIVEETYHDGGPILARPQRKFASPAVLPVPLCKSISSLPLMPPKSELQSKLDLV